MISLSLSFLLCVCVCVCVCVCGVVWCGVVWCGVCVCVCKNKENAHTKEIKSQSHFLGNDHLTAWFVNMLKDKSKNFQFLRLCFKIFVDFVLNLDGYPMTVMKSHGSLWWAVKLLVFSDKQTVLCWAPSPALFSCKLLIWPLCGTMLTAHWVWFQHSNECNLLHVTAADISHHQWMCAIMCVHVLKIIMVGLRVPFLKWALGMYISYLNL